jgi:hypothetical protein
LARAIFNRFYTACGDIPRSVAISFAVWGRSRRRKHSFSFAVNLARAISPGSSVRMLSVSLMKLCYRSNVCLPRTFRFQNAKLKDFVSAQHRQEPMHPPMLKLPCVGQAHSVAVSRSAARKPPVRFPSHYEIRELIAGLQNRSFAKMNQRPKLGSDGRGMSVGFWVITYD